MTEKHYYQFGHLSLRELYSFVPAGAIETEVVKQLRLFADEILVGMYINDASHFIVFTTRAIHWFRKEREIICPYATINEIKLPEDEKDVADEREIELVLNDGDFLFLPVLGDTEEIPDIFVVAKYLEETRASAANLQSLGDLIKQLKKAVDEYESDKGSWSQPMPVQYIRTVIAYLEGCLLECVNGGLRSRDDGKYDMVTLNQPQTWRLLAEVLLAPRAFDIGGGSDHER